MIEILENFKKRINLFNRRKNNELKIGDEIFVITKIWERKEGKAGRYNDGYDFHYVKRKKIGKIREQYDEENFYVDIGGSVVLYHISEIKKK